ncbi:pilin [Achromobacter xylosoxidans]
MNNKNKKGFTMIELMITVAIVGALTAIAIPAYQDYVIRSQVSEGITLASGAKPLVLEYYANNGEYPKNNQDVGYGGAVGKFVSNVEIRNDSIVATLSNEVNSKIAGKKVVLTTTVNEGTEIKLSF